MSHYNSSSARVLEVSIPQYTAAKPVGNPVRLKVVKREKRQGNLAFVNFKNIVLFLSVVACIWVVISNQVQINEINNQINKINAEITELESDYVRMQSSLESTLSIKNVTKQAEQELGMQRVDQYQVVHVRIYEEDSVEIKHLPEPEGFSEQVETFAVSIARYFEGFFSKS